MGVSLLQRLAGTPAFNSILNSWKTHAYCNLSVTNITFTRNTSFFNKLPAADIWHGVTAVSNAGKKRGRGKGTGKKMAKDLNKGQIIGHGKENIIWPGLNTPVLRGKDLIYQQKLPKNYDREKNIIRLRDSMVNFRMMKLNPIDRGWSGTKMPGRSIETTNVASDSILSSFDTRVLESKIVFIMKGNMGRKRRYSVMTVTGNGNGLAGFATAKAPEVRTALRKSKNRAVQKLMSIHLCENRTIHHDFYTAFGNTKIFVSRKPKGYGLVCHRAIQTMCRVMGIQDLYAKIEGSTNIQHIVKAFFIGLLQQKSYKDIANESNMFIVECQKDKMGLTEIKAAPDITWKISENIVDFKQFNLGNKIVLRKKAIAPFYTNSKGHNLYIKKAEQFRNQHYVRLEKKMNDVK